MKPLLLIFLLLPLPKSFLSFLFSKPCSSTSEILQKTKVCYIFSFSPPFAKNNSTRTNRLNSFCVSLLPFPKERVTNHLNSFVSPFSLSKRIQRTNRLRILCLNTLEGTSFVVQERVHLLWISLSGGYIHLVVQREQGRAHPLWIFACNGFYKVGRNLKNRWLLGDWM